MPRPAPLVIRHRSLAIPRRCRRRGGFALLITITLLAFLVLLLVSLAALTRVETQVASNNQQLAQARQNALLALNIALGQLQKHAGPDQRVTARADIDPDLEQRPNSRWTGVYGSAVAADYDQAPADIATALTTSTQIDTETGSQAVLLNWLVSGNETAPFDPASHVGARGQITTSPVAGISFQPAQAVQNLTTTTAATATNLTLNGAPARLLVGAGSTRTDVDGSNVPVDYVIAPLVTITTSAVPGLDPGDPVDIGRYAWWVGDEGVKARVNLSRPSSPDPAELARALAAPPRAAVELMAAAGPSAPDLDGALIGVSNYDIERSSELVASRQLPMLNAGSSTLAEFAQNRFHDLTAHSYSVLSDTYAGGLRRDLTRLLVDGQTTANTGAAARLFTPDPATQASSNDQYVPTWGLLRSHYHALPLNPDGSLSPRLPTPTESGIAPVITYYSLGWRYATVGPATQGAEITLNLYPLVVLWNPYTVPIRAPANHYEVGIFPTYNVETWLEKNEPGYAPPPGTNFSADWPRVEARHFQRIRNLGTEYIRFRIDCPEIGPGESRVFALVSSGDAYPVVTSQPPPVLQNVTPDPTRYATLSTGLTVEYAADPDNPGGPPVPREYRVFARTASPGNVGSSFGGGAGGVLAYLGEARADSATSWFENQHNPWTATPKRWYGAHQDIEWQSLSVPGSILQGPATLAPGAGEEPVYVFMTQAVFAGDGSNGINGVLPSHHLYPSRWIAQANLRAPISGRTRRDLGVNIHYSGIAGIHGGTLNWQNFVLSPLAPERTSAGLGHDVGPDGPVDVTLFEVRSPSEAQLFSIGQLQQAPLSTVSAYPSYAVGNSLADFRLTAQQLVATANHGSSLTRLALRMEAYHDLSYLLNRSLWDRHFFSAIPASETLSINPRVVRHGDLATTDLLQPDRAAAGLLVAGGFNVNSTSEQAWRAVLGGTSRLDYGASPPAWAPSDSALSPLSRFSRPVAGPDGTGWESYRTLTARQIAELARNIVEEVRSRGPFVSIGDFVNRRLVDTATNVRGYKGALQAAIDRATGPGGINDTTDAFWTDSENVGSIGTPYVLQHFRGGPGNPADGIGNRSAFAPKYLTQADVLSAIGSVISARSDTFTVRAYGETLDPVNSTASSPVVTASAWCEAVIQRLPGHVDASIDPWDSPATGSVGAFFGRKFQIVSFRWLSPEDI